MTDKIINFKENKMEEKFNVFIPKTYNKIGKVYGSKVNARPIDYKEAIVNNDVDYWNTETQNFLDNCDFEVKEFSKEYIENLFEKGFILIRLSKTESINQYKEAVKRGFNLMFMKTKAYMNLRQQFTEVTK